MSDQPVRHLRVTGRVQGVGYRITMVAVAEQLAVTGWVRNCRDGSVEAMIQGDGKALDDLVAWAQRGPPHARVEKVEVEPGSGSFTAFSARPDA